MSSFRTASIWISLFTVSILLLFANKPLFRDEAFSYYSSSQSLHDLVSEVKVTNIYYFSYYVTLHIWLYFAHNVIWARLFSITALGLSIYEIGLTARLLGLKSNRFLPSIFLATSPLAIQESLYLRPYALSILVSVVFINQVIIFDKSKEHHLGKIFLISLILLSIDIHAVAFIFPIVFLVIIKKHKYTSGNVFLSIFQSIFLVLSFFIFSYFVNIQSEGDSWYSSYFHSIPLWINLEGPASSSTGLFPIAGSSLYPIGVLALLCLGLISYLTTRKNKTLRLVKRWALGVTATWAFLPTVAMVGISLVHPIYITRYITYSVPGLAILMAIACESIYTNFTLIKSKIVKPILFSAVLGAALVWTFITCDIPVAKTYAYNLWAAEKYIASNGGPNAEIILPTISLETAITYYANIDHNSFTYWPQGKNIWSATSLNLDQESFAAASSNVWLVYENSYDDAPIVASLREHGYAQTGTTLIEGVALIHFEKH
jgi:mannosyltransferase